MNNDYNDTKVFLVGSGPGDTGLITVKGLELVRKADVILYDKLGAQQFLNEAKPGCELIDVGKYSGNHKMNQEAINEAIVQKALENSGKNIVVRLKGGDPFIFGRGGEEAEHLKKCGIKFEIVPGVTSAISAPTYAGIPITMRGYTTSFAVVTGHESEKEKSQTDWKAVAGIGTIVILMGVRNLSFICQQLIDNGKSPNTPIAAIQNATLSIQRTIVGTLATMPQLAEKENLTSPAVMVVGDVVSLRENIKWFENKPLFGKSIVVTRARNQASELTKALKDLGAEVFECPTIKILNEYDKNAFDNFVSNASSFNYAIFTSVNGVKNTFELLFKKNKDSRIFANIKIATIGSSTAEELKKYGLIADIIPDKFISESLIECFKTQKIGKVAIFKAEKTREIIPEELKKLGFEAVPITVYKTINETELNDIAHSQPPTDFQTAWLNKENDLSLKEKLINGKIDLVTFTSSSTAENFKQILVHKGLSNIEIPAAAIGPITAETCKKCGFNVKIVAKEYTIKDLVKQISKLRNE